MRAKRESTSASPASAGSASFCVGAARLVGNCFSGFGAGGCAGCDVLDVDTVADLGGRGIRLFIGCVRRALGGAHLDLGQRFGCFEERALHDAIRVEQVVTAAAQLVDLSLQQTAPAEEIGEHALTRRLRFVEHLASLATRRFDQLLGLAIGPRALLGFVRLDRGA